MLSAESKDCCPITNTNPLQKPKEEHVGIIGQAISYTEITEELQVDLRTIEPHKAKLSRKLDFKTKHELALMRYKLD